MLKKSFLTPVLSGVLAVAVVGSGVLYYFDRSGDKGKNNEKSGENGISRVSDNIGETIDIAGKALKGELDFSYAADAELKFGEGITNDIGYEIKPIGISTATKQKGKKTAADMSFKYDSKNLMSLNTVIDNETQTVYIKCPELSDSYLSASADDIDDLMAESGISMDDYTLESATGSLTAMSVGSASASLLDVLDEVDYEALTADLEEYCKLIEENCPEGKENGSVSGDINGNAYDYSVKTYEITGQVVYDMVVDMTEKAKSDEFLKNLFVKMGVSESDYDAAVGSIAPSMESVDMDEVLLSVDVYFDGDNAVGFATSVDDELDVKMISIETDEVYAVDMNFTADGEGFTLKGAAKEQDGKVNGKFDLNVSGSEEMGMSLTMTDIQAQGELFSGSIKCELSYSEEAFLIDGKGYDDEAGVSYSPSIELISNSTADKLDLTLNVEEGGKNYFTMTVTGQETDASDITVPSDNIFSLDEAGLESYAATCKTDEFLAGIKEALGDELYNEILGSDGTVYDDYDYNDYYDYEIDSDNEDDYSANDYGELYYDYDYDLSKCDIKLNGKAFSLPAKFSEVQSDVVADIKTIEASDGYWFDSEDYSLSVNVYNTGDTEIDVKDADITSIADYQGNWLSIDGITAGDAVSDLEKTYDGLKVKDTDYTNVVLGSDDIYFVFCIEEGVISYISYYDDTVYHNY
ncbi:DUF6583 family protein [Ruminococcus sp. Marseille-P6503]|uniref:DUF6583 family protein n=1 Tax=Ruminococcus sp. Marseille-P6503 TaxID=2364796 RepID=UPI000F533C89|nr:DUF6583 family protein [Ruminococcus sp. Marseille-P6503]